MIILGCFGVPPFKETPTWFRHIFRCKLFVLGSVDEDSYFCCWSNQGKMNPRCQKGHQQVTSASLQRKAKDPSLNHGWVLNDVFPKTVEAEKMFRVSKHCINPCLNTTMLLSLSFLAIKKYEPDNKKLYSYDEPSIPTIAYINQPGSFSCLLWLLISHPAVDFTPKDLSS